MIPLALLLLVQGGKPWVNDGPDKEEDLQVLRKNEPLSATWGGFGKGVKKYVWTARKKVPGKKAVDAMPEKEVEGQKTSDQASIALEPGATYYLSVTAHYEDPRKKPRTANSDGARVERDAPPAEGLPPSGFAGEKPMDQLLEFAKNAAGLSGKRAPEDVGDAVIAALENPVVRSAVLREILNEDTGLRLLKDLNLELKVLDVNEGSPALGVGYDWEKVVKAFDFAAARVSGAELKAKASGTVAFDREKNPEDFLVSAVSFDVYASWGGTREKWSDADAIALQDLGRRMADIPDRDSLHRSDVWREFNRVVQDRLTTQVYVELGGQAALESNQSFSEKQAVFEAVLALDIKAWNSDSLEALANLPDWPFAFVRAMTGYDDRIAVRGSSIPTVQAAIGFVNPMQDDDPRGATGDDTSFWRGRVELSFRTPVARVAGSTVHFNANVRYYRELKPRDAVELVEQDEFLYAMMDVASENGVYVGYAAGKLPLDEEKDQVYEVGWRVRF